MMTQVNKFMSFGLGLLLACGLGAIEPARADSAAIVKNLQERSASLAELSIARIEALLNAVGVKEGFSAFAFFQDDGLQFYISDLASEPSEARCKALIDIVKRTGGVDPETGWPDNPASVYASYLNYGSFDAYAVDQSYDETVDGMISILAVIGVTGDGKGMVCKSKLLSAETSYQWE